MRIERVSGGDDDMGVNRSKPGRRSRVSWLRTTKAGREAIASFAQYLSAGASIRSASGVLGVSSQTLERWIRAGVDGKDDDSVWFVETIQSALQRSVANAEVRVFKTNPLAWLRQSPASRVANSGWSESRKADDIKEETNIGLGYGVESGKRIIGEKNREREGRGGDDSSSISSQSKLAALYELRKAGLDLNSLIDSQLTRESYIDSTVSEHIGRASYLLPSGTNDHESCSLNHNTRNNVRESNDVETGSISIVNQNTRNGFRESKTAGLSIDRAGNRMTKSPAPSGGTPVWNGPNDLPPQPPQLLHHHDLSSSSTTFDVTPIIVGTNGSSGFGTPATLGSNTPPMGTGTPVESGSNTHEILSEKLLMDSGNDDTIKGRIAAILASGRARSVLGEERG